jgi:hypothetical protein
LPENRFWRNHSMKLPYHLSLIAVVTCVSGDCTRTFFLPREGDEPLACCGRYDGDGLDLPFDGTGEKEFESSRIADGEIPAVELPPGLLKGNAVVAVFTSESGKPGGCPFFNLRKKPSKALPTRSITSCNVWEHAHANSGKAFFQIGELD